MLVVFGGANFEGEMGREHLRSVPWIDYAIDGEADLALPAFLAALAEGRRSPGDPAACVGRRAGEVVGTHERARSTRLDELPIPDFDEFFERAEALGLLPPGGRREVELPFESAAGCWWGAQAPLHVLRAQRRRRWRYRAKSRARVLGELAVLAQRYRTFQFVAVDNILEPSYFETLFPLISRHGFTYQHVLRGEVEPVDAPAADAARRRRAGPSSPASSR